MNTFINGGYTIINNPSSSILALISRDFSEPRTNDQIKKWRKQEHDAEPDFLKALEIIIQSCKESDSGADVCQRLLVSFYNSNDVDTSDEMNLLSNDLQTSWFEVYTYQTIVNKKDIHLYLPQHTEYIENLVSELNNKD